MPAKPKKPELGEVARSEAQAINALHQQLEELSEAVRRDGNRTVALATKIGRRLIQAKEKIGHGNFLLWIRTNLKFSDDTARRYMQLAQAPAANPAHVRNTDTETTRAAGDTDSRSAALGRATGLRRAYVAAGILPTPPPPPRARASTSNPFAWYRHIDALVEELSPRTSLDDADKTALRQLFELLKRLL